MLNDKINPGKVFDLTLPLDQVAEGYAAMDERRAIKTLLVPQGTVCGLPSATIAAPTARSVSGRLPNIY